MASDEHAIGNWRTMKYRYKTESVHGTIQLIAASYLRHGFYWYVTGSIPKGKDPEVVDRKLIAKYQIAVSEWERRRRKKAGLANAHYIRFENWFIILVSEGHHVIKQPTSQGGEREQLKDCRVWPIHLNGYSVSYRRSGVVEPGQLRRRRAHVRIDKRTYNQLKSYFESIAVHRHAESLANEIKSISFARYAPIRRQLLNIARCVNRLRAAHGYETIPYSKIGLRRQPVKVYEETGDDQEAL